MPVFIDCPSIGVDERGEAVYETVKWAIESSAFQLTPDELRSRMAVSNSDGAFACGESSHHRPMKSWSLRWQPKHRSPWQSWDAFHWLNAAGNRAMNRSTLAQRLMTLLKNIEAQVGGGQGRSFDRQSAQFMDKPVIAGMVLSGKRELGCFLADACPVARRIADLLQSL